MADRRTQSYAAVPSPTDLVRAQMMAGRVSFFAPPTVMPEHVTVTRDDERFGAWIECRVPHEGQGMALRTFVLDTQGARETETQIAVGTQLRAAVDHRIRELHVDPEDFELEIPPSPTFWPREEKEPQR